MLIASLEDLRQDNTDLPQIIYCYRVGFRMLFFKAITSPGPARPKGAGDQATVCSQPPF